MEGNTPERDQLQELTYMIRHGTSPTSKAERCASEPLLENNEGRHERPKHAVVRNRSGNRIERPSTPSPLKSSSPISPSRKHIQIADSTIQPLHANTWCVGMRWVLLGIVIGSSLTGISQSVSMPRACSGVPNEAHFTHHGDMTPGVHPPEQLLMAVQTSSMLAKAHSEIQANEGNDRHAQATGDKSISKPKQKVLPTKPLILNFTNLPPPPVLGANDTFAACLLIKDDNHWRKY
jgi:hypothetical protein